MALTYLRRGDGASEDIISSSEEYQSVPGDELKSSSSPELLSFDEAVPCELYELTLESARSSFPLHDPDRFPEIQLLRSEHRYSGSVSLGPASTGPLSSGPCGEPAGGKAERSEFAAARSQPLILKSSPLDSSPNGGARNGPAQDLTPWTIPWYEDQLLTRKASEPPSRQVSYSYQGVGYSSLSEAACGALLELYIPGFRVVEGETYQIPIGKGRSVDFLIDGVLFEYHPPRLIAERRGCGDFPNHRAYEQFRRTFNRVRYDKRRRETLLAATVAELGEHYYHRRRAMLDEHPIYKDCELVVATGIQEFYQRVIQRFGLESSVSPEHFSTLFYAFVKTVARQNSRRGVTRSRSSRPMIRQDRRRSRRRA